MLLLYSLFTVGWVFAWRNRIFLRDLFFRAVLIVLFTQRLKRFTCYVEGRDRIKKGMFGRVISNFHRHGLCALRNSILCDFPACLLSVCSFFLSFPVPDIPFIYLYRYEAWRLGWPSPGKCALGWPLPVSFELWQLRQIWIAHSMPTHRFTQWDDY